MSDAVRCGVLCRAPCPEPGAPGGCGLPAGHRGPHCGSDSAFGAPISWPSDAQTLAVRADVGAIRERQAGCAHEGVAAGRMCLGCGAVVAHSVADKSLPEWAAGVLESGRRRTQGEGTRRVFDAIDAELAAQPPHADGTLTLVRGESGREPYGDVRLLLRRGPRAFVATVAGAVADEAPGAGLRQVAAGIVAGILR